MMATMAALLFLGGGMMAALVILATLARDWRRISDALMMRPEPGTRRVHAVVVRPAAFTRPARVPPAAAEPLRAAA